MSEYRLSRCRSAAVIRAGSVDSRPSLLLTRTYSVPDVTSYVRASERYKPQWPSYYTYRTYWPYRYYRDNSLYEDYWYDRYYYFSPLYYRSLFPRRYYYSDYIPNPYYSYNNYWTKYKAYDYDYPSYYSRYSNPYYYSYLSSYYRPYSYYSMTDSLYNGLWLYRKGIINFSVLNHNWLTSNTWDKKFKNYRLLYNWEDYSVPAYYNRNARQYSTEWVDD